MKRLTTLFFVYILSIIYCFGQYNIIDPKSTLKQSTPLSPDVANIDRYVMSPPNLSNGLPQQNIPLFEIKENGVSFPMSLFYNYSGFRVKEEATSVGLGWGLTDAMIVREVKHIPDDHMGLMKKFEDCENEIVRIRSKTGNLNHDSFLLRQMLKNLIREVNHLLMYQSLSLTYIERRKVSGVR